MEEHDAVHHVSNISFDVTSIGFNRVCIGGVTAPGIAKRDSDSRRTLKCGKTAGEGSKTKALRRTTKAEIILEDCRTTAILKVYL